MLPLISVLTTEFNGQHHSAPMALPRLLCSSLIPNRDA
jgi:hypothetical protein